MLVNPIGRYESGSERFLEGIPDGNMATKALK